MTWAPDYLTVEELKSYLRIGDNVDDVELASAISAASRAVDTCCSRQFGQVASAQARTYAAYWDRGLRTWAVETDDVADLTGATVTNDGAATTDYDWGPVNAVAKGKVYTHLLLNSGGSSACYPDYRPTAAPEIVVTAKWGWTSVPATVAFATKIQAHRFITRRDSPLGVAGSPDQGTELRLLAKVDPDVEIMLGTYRRRWAAA